jgi:acetolactate synthase-1/3 small subunit
VKKIQQNYRTLVITVDNKFGVLARVSGLFSRRGVNIKSLAVAPTDKAEFSRITVDLDIELESVGATAKDLIFTPRREKRPLTRAKTPNLLSTVITKVL